MKRVAIPRSLRLALPLCIAGLLCLGATGASASTPSYSLSVSEGPTVGGFSPNDTFASANDSSQTVTLEIIGAEGLWQAQADPVVPVHGR